MRSGIVVLSSGTDARRRPGNDQFGGNTHCLFCWDVLFDWLYNLEIEGGRERCLVGKLI